VFDTPPAPGVAPTCDTAGVLGPTTAAIGAFQAAEAIKVLVGNYAATRRAPASADLWSNTWQQIRSAEQDPACPVCVQRVFEHLSATGGGRAAALCGRNAVQVAPPGGRFDFDATAERLAGIGAVERNDFLLKTTLRESDHEFTLTLFSDGRAIIHGTDEVQTARNLYSRYVGT